VAQAGAAGLIASYSREQELQADKLGAEYLARTSYDPTNMVDVIQVLKDQERYAADAAKAAGRAAPAAGGNRLASHPTSDQRLADIRSLATLLAASRPGGWGDDGRDRYLKAIAGVTFGDGREHGVVRGRNFFHETLGIAITAPAGFRIGNESDQLRLVNAAGDAALVMRLVPPGTLQKTGREHDAILKQALGATTGRTEKLSLGGLPATSFSGQRRDAQGNTGPLEATIVDGPGGNVYLLGRLAKNDEARDRARASLREAEASFRPLSAAERAQARPWRVKLVPYPAGGFAQLARGSPLPELAEQQLRLLNGVYGGHAEPKVGQMVKVVE
jgi:predicted Zn-dependent protease